MVSLVIAPAVSSRSRHIEVHHHYIRQLSARQYLRLIYVPSADMRANVLTKLLARLQFLAERDVMFNRVAPSL